ncbi:MAG: hypothetical protein FWC48_03475 [Actinomycetia bacterium]|nr:hypothetical protein [Actinomycetes bacterium]
MAEAGSVNPTPLNTGSPDADSRTMSPLMKALIVAAGVVVLLVFIVMFLFTTMQNQPNSASRQTTTQSSTDKSSTDKSSTDKSSTTDSSSLGPISVDMSTLYNRENTALGQSGSGPQSSITNAPVDIPAPSRSGITGP